MSQPFRRVPQGSKDSKVEKSLWLDSDLIWMGFGESETPVHTLIHRGASLNSTDRKGVHLDGRREPNPIKLRSLSGVGGLFSPFGRDAEGREGNALLRIFLSLSVEFRRALRIQK